MSEKQDLKLGELLPKDHGLDRDAIHIAVVPVEAFMRLEPGEHVGLRADGKATSNDNPIGIVDPYLDTDVLRGQTFWLFLYPNTITSLRHHWEHPAFKDEPKPKPDPSTVAKEEAERWLRNFANECDMSYGQLIQGMHEYLRDGSSIVLGTDTPEIAYSGAKQLWKNFSLVTGTVVPQEEAESAIFSCAC